MERERRRSEHAINYLFIFNLLIVFSLVGIIRIMLFLITCRCSHNFKNRVELAGLIGNRSVIRSDF